MKSPIIAGALITSVALAGLTNAGHASASAQADPVTANDCGPDGGLRSRVTATQDRFEETVAPYFATAGEPIRLSGFADLPDTYALRFTWLPQSGAPVIALLLEVDIGAWGISARKLGDGEITDELLRPLTADETAELNTLFDACPVADMATTLLGADAGETEHFIESAGPDGRYVIYRTVSDAGDLPALSAFALDLTGWVEPD